MNFRDHDFAKTHSKFGVPADQDQIGAANGKPNVKIAAEKNDRKNNDITEKNSEIPGNVEDIIKDETEMTDNNQDAAVQPERTSLNENTPIP